MDPALEAYDSNVVLGLPVQLHSTKVASSTMSFKVYILDNLSIRPLPGLFPPLLSDPIPHEDGFAVFLRDAKS